MCSKCAHITVVDSTTIVVFTQDLLILKLLRLCLVSLFQWFQFKSAFVAFGFSDHLLSHVVLRNFGFCWQQFVCYCDDGNS